MSENIKIISQNKKARFNYFLSDFLEAGIVLSGTEIKSIRLHNVNLDDAYVLIRNNQAYIINMNIPVYEKGTIFNHEPKRDRKLLLHKYEIRKLDAKVERKGFTLIPTKVYLKNGKAKIEIALGQGKKLFDKRETIKQRENQREINKIMKEKRYEK
ncbi:MAG: SsrA-binding protein SmpB [Firmicutes bacterium]|nr:SsrA-binding protein SmpB [Candidatus Alectryobacillus merdavium]